MSEFKLIGKQAIDFGFSSDEQIKHALEAQKKRQTNGQNIRLGELLVQQGAITSQQLEILLDASALDKVSLSEDAIRLAIRLHSTFDKGSNLLLFTNIKAGESASQVASQVAHALTLIDGTGKTILIDANFHDPNIHKTFSLPLSPGLSEVVTATESLDSAKTSSCVKGLSILSAGEVNPLIVSRLISRGFNKLIEDIRDKYSIIIINTANILQEPEAVLLASKANQVISVTAKGAATKTELREIDRLVNNIGSSFAGVILYQNAKEGKE